MPYPPLLPASDIDAVLETAVGRPLAALGFEPIAKRKWIRSTAAPFRHLLDVSALKGAAFTFRWGFSLDYVPHVGGNRVRWHRTNKSARFDVCFDPMDFAPHEPPLLSAFAARVAFARAASERLESNLPTAVQFWGDYGSLTGILAACEWLKGLPSRRFGFYNYVRHPLTLAFTLRKLGQNERAQPEFERFISIAGEREETIRELRGAFAATHP
jgi:hypothetical protein